MSTDQRHIIRSKEFRFRAGDEAEAKRWQKWISGKVNNIDFLDRLGRRLDALIGPGQLLQLDRLEISMKLNEKDFENNLLSAIEDGLKTVIEEEQDGKIAVSKGNYEALVHFLNFGHLPWWATLHMLGPGHLSKSEIEKIKPMLGTRPRTLIRFARISSLPFLYEHFVSPKIKPEKVKEALAFFEQAFELLLKVKRNRSQFLLKKALIETALQPIVKVNSLSKSLINNLLENLKESEREQLRSWYRHYSLQEDPPPLKPDFGDTTKEQMLALATSFDALPASVKRRVKLSLEGSSKRTDGSTGGSDWNNPLTTSEAVEEELNDLLSSESDLKHGDSKTESSWEADGEQILEEALEEGVFMPQAGLILLHPFLPRLFGEMGLLDEKAFKNAASQQKAIQMLGWLASGMDDLQESELVMAKLLAGYPLTEPLAFPDTLSEEEIQLGTELLEAVLQHWKALGSSSIHGLREGFLMREGKLSLEDRGYRIIVERKTLDILLDKLPWSIGMARVPWCKYVIFTDWS